MQHEHVPHLKKKGPPDGGGSATSETVSEIEVPQAGDVLREIDLAMTRAERLDERVRTEGIQEERRRIGGCGCSG